MAARTIDIKIVEGQITAFKNPEKHYNKEFRTLQGCCTKIIGDLDKVDVNDCDDLRQMRKAGYIQVDKVLETLVSRVHEDGIPCSMCEIKS